MSFAERTVMVLLAGWSLGACSAEQPASTLPPLTSTGIGPKPARVVLVGDSLAVEAFPQLQAMLADQELLNHTFGGTAPCDWLDVDLGITADSVVVLSFIGNAATDCMSVAGEYLRNEELAQKYRTDVAALVALATAAGAMVVLVGQPALGGDNTEGNTLVATLNAMYAEFAGAPGVSFVDSGAALETDAGAFAAALPCLPDEPTCDAAGLVAVRSADGVHFCPSGFSATCPTHSPGAFRFAAAIVSAAQHPNLFD